MARIVRFQNVTYSGRGGPHNQKIKNFAVNTDQVITVYKGVNETFVAMKGQNYFAVEDDFDEVVAILNGKQTD